MQLSRFSRIRIVPFVSVVVGLMVACSCLPATPVAQPGKPTVTITAPANNSQVPVGQPTTIQVSAADAQGVTRIEVKVDNALVATPQSSDPQGQTTLTIALDWTFAQAGSHAIAAQAFNAAGQASDVAAVTVQAVVGVAVQPSPTMAPGEPAPTAAPPPPTTAPPAAPVVKSFTANPATITAGGSSTLQWEVTGATSVQIDQGVGGVAASGSKQVSPAATTTYKLTAQGAGGSTTATARVAVQAAPPPAKPVVKSFTANPASITAGGSSTLQWEVTGATSVQIDQGVGSVAASGSKQVSPAATTTYKLTAQGAGGTATKQVQVQVNPPAPKATFNDYPSAVAYLEGGQPRIYAFSKGDNGRLYVNYWNGAKWQWADQGKPSGTNAGNLGDAIAFLEGNSPRIYAFTSSGSHLYVNYWNGSKWQWADQGAPTSDAISAPGVITYREGGTQRIYAFVRSANGHLYVNYWNGAKWQWADQGKPTNADVSGAPGVITYLEDGKQRIYAFVRGSDSHLHVNYWNGAKWQWADQGMPSGASVNSGPGVIAYLEGGKPRIYAFVRGSNGHLLINYWNGIKWQWADHGAPKAGVNVTASPAAVTLQTGNVHNIDVFVRGSDNHLYSRYRTFSGQWKWEDRGTPQGATVLSVPSVTTYLETELQFIHAFVIGSDHRLHVLYGDGGGQWKWSVQGLP